MSALSSSFEVHDFGAEEVLVEQYPHLLTEIESVLGNFRFSKSDILSPGGGKSLIAGRLDKQFYGLGWEERKFEFDLHRWGRTERFETHLIDCFKPGVAIEIEWNNKDTFFDRDLNGYRVLYDEGLIRCGVIITRSSSLHSLFKDLISEGLSATKYVSTTTHVKRLLPKIFSGAAGRCPLVVYGITEQTFLAD